MAQMELQLPELTVEDFQRAWTHFELVSAAKEWNAEKQLTILPTLLRGKLIDFYTEFDGDTKSSLSTLKKALQEKAGLLDNPLVASKSFNQRDQLSTEEVSEYAGVLKRLFKQAYPAEGMDSTVLLQRFLTGVRPSIARQMLLLGKKPANLAEAIKDATAVEFALRFDQDKAEQLASAESVNVLRSGNNNKPIPKPVAQHDDVAKLQKTVETLTKQMELLQATLQKPQRTPVWKNQRGRRRDRPIGPCFNCGQEGHHYRQCPLNYQGPAPKVEARWSNNQ